MRTLIRKCDQNKTCKSAIFTSRQGYKNQEKKVNVYKNVQFGVIICTEHGPRKWDVLVLDMGYLS